MCLLCVWHARDPPPPGSLRLAELATEGFAELATEEFDWWQR